MVSILPKEIFSMNQKRRIVKRNASRYKRMSKKEKGEMLRELEEITGYKRKYIIYLLSLEDKVVFKRRGLIVKVDITKTFERERGRKKRYGEELIPHLRMIWRLSGFISSVHLKFFIEENWEWIMKNKYFYKVRKKDKELIREMSSSTIERLLRDEKKKYNILSKYKSRKGRRNHIKKQIKIESFYNRKVEKVGYIEMDLVSHSGSSGKGEFFYTLTAVDVKTDWTSLRLLRNKARIWMHKALSDIFSKLPYVAYHIHSDNGSEFMNDHIISFIRENGLTQTRSRAYKKNDNALVEAKNWTMVRTYTGYRRYDTDEEFKILSELLNLIELKHNLFVPTMKVKRREERDGKMRKVYETKTPLKRLLEASEVYKNKKTELIMLKKSVNIYELNKKIKRLLVKLDNAYNKKYSLNSGVNIDLSLDYLDLKNKCLNKKYISDFEGR